MSVHEKMTAIADAIRGKTGGTDALTLDHMATEIAGIETGGGEPEVLFDGAAAYVLFNATLPDSIEALGANVAQRYPEQYTYMNSAFGTKGIQEGCAPGVVLTAGHYPFANQNTTLTKVVAPKCVQLEDGYWAYKCTNLEYVQLGSVGYPVTLMDYANGFKGCTNSNLMIEIYVDATTIADIPTEVTQYAPWSATTATIVYRNSTTGEVITT